MAKREDEEKKRAEDPEDEGGLGTSSDREEEEEETAGETDESEDGSSEEDESEQDSSEDEDEDDDDEDDDAPKADHDESEDGEQEDDESDEKAAASDADGADEESVAEAAKLADDDAADDDAPPAQLGAQRYVMATFFGGALLFAYLLGRAIDGIWLNLATRDWLVERAPVVAAVADEDKAMYATIAGGVIALVMAIRTSRNPEIRQWTDDVSSELLKVKWPTRKEVYASTVVVLTTSAVAVVYLFLLDRFWGFVTNQIYGTGL